MIAESIKATQTRSRGLSRREGVLRAVKNPLGSISQGTHPDRGKAVVVPNPEVPDKAVRRRFTVEYKLRILNLADARTELGSMGELLRQEGLYASKGKCTAFALQHSAIGKNWLNYYFCPDEIPSYLEGKRPLWTIPLPDLYLASGVYPYEVMVQNKIPEYILRLCGAVRYDK